MSEQSEQIDPRFRLRGTRIWGGCVWEIDEVDRVSLAVEIARLRQELGQSRVNEGEAMLVLEGTEAKLEEAQQAIQERHDLAMENANEWYACQAENEKLRAALQAVTEQEPGYGGPTATGRGYESCGRCEETSELAAKALKESTGRVTESPAGKP